MTTTTTSPFDRKLNLVGKRFRCVDKLTGHSLFDAEIVFERVGFVDYRILTGVRVGQVTMVDRVALERGSNAYYHYEPLAEDRHAAVPSVA